MRIQLYVEYESVSEDAESKIKTLLTIQKWKNKFPRNAINLSRASRLERERFDPTNRNKLNFVSVPSWLRLQAH
jgi:hypothetical protein